MAPNANFVGFGLGLRPSHFHDALESDHNVDWFEVISENFFVAGGKPRYYLKQVRERFPVALHGVSLSIGSKDPLDRQYLQQLKTLIDDVQPQVVSDHACWTSFGGTNSHDLLPLPYTQEAVQHVSARVREVQDILGRQILLENVSAYVSFTNEELSESAFLNAVAQESGCGLLLDVNNIYVNQRNLGADAKQFLLDIDPHHVQQIHIAGHSDYGDHVIDTHDAPVCDAVLDLYELACGRLGPINTMIERDDDIPEFSVLLDELNEVRHRAEKSTTLAVTNS